MKRLPLLVVVGLLGLWLLSLIAGYDVVADVQPDRAGLSVSAAHWLGCDHLGRDVLWRMVTASEAFVGPGLLSCLACLLLGGTLGGLSGWLGGAPSQVLRYLFSVVASLPRFVLVLLICAIYGDSPVVLALAAGLAYTPTLGEAISGRIEQLRRSEFVEAAQAHGMSDAAVLLRELLWSNCRALIGRHLLYLFGYFLVLETTLSYIGGFGVEEPQPSWGNMLAFEFGIQDGNLLAWLAPATAIWLTVLATTLAAGQLEEVGHG
ncbi:MAG: peptide/nickel transport system permease protein [Myxococcota bacterium]|jgi:peptide/nickel transport system permease protein